MTSCDSPWTGLIMIFMMLILPLGLPILGLALHAWARRSPWSRLGVVIVSGVGFVVFLSIVSRYPADPQWLPWVFAPPFVAGAIAVLWERRAAQAAMLFASCVPTLGGVAFGLYRYSAYSCPI